MTKKEIFELHKVLDSCGRLTGAKFAYAIARNMALIRPICKEIEQAIAPTEEYTAYDTERAELAKSHAQKNKDGIENTNMNEHGEKQYIIVDQKKFDAEHEELKTKHAEAIDARESQIEEFKKTLEEEVEVNFYKMPLDIVPEGINSAQMEGILCLIEEK